MTGSEGQDWASYQAPSPSTKGLTFTFTKATEGVSYTNPRYASQLAASRSAGLVTGHYHFARPTSSMKAQADYFLARASLKKGDPIALDWEDKGVSTAEKDQWIRYVQSKAPGHKVGLYCNKDFWLNRDSTGFYGDFLWIADPDNTKGHPGIRTAWLFHQYSEAGGIDRNYCPLTAAQLKAWANGTVTPQEDDLSAMDVLGYRNAKADAASVAAGHGHIPDFYGYVVQTNAEVKAMHATIAAMVPLIGKNVDTPTVVKAVQDAIANATVHVQVDVTGDDPTTT